jgi:glycosyltransferase involved in cell wall biosynthesis
MDFLSNKKTMRTLIIIPAYNEEGSIEGVIRKIRAASREYDIVVINDCSTDHTRERAGSLGVAVISLSVNLGIGGAVQTGFKYAYYNRYDAAVQVDGDGQHNPQFVKRLLEPIGSGLADVVVGSRFIHKKGFQSGRLRRLGIRLFQLLNNVLLRQNITDSTSGFRAYNAGAIALLQENYPSDYPEPEALFLLKKREFRIAEVPVEMNSRDAGTSSISGLKSVYYMIKVTISILVECLRKKDG